MRGEGQGGRPGLELRVVAAVVHEAAALIEGPLVEVEARGHVAHVQDRVAEAHRAGHCRKLRKANTGSIRTRLYTRYQLDPDGRNRRLGRARAQPQGPPPEAAARRADRHHRAVGLRQVEPCLRHDLRRGPAPLRRVAVGLRAPVPRPDGQAGRGLDRGPVAGDLDRPEDDLAQPALDRRDGHRDLRLPAPAVGPDRAIRTATTAAARSRRSRPSRSSTR